MEHELPLRSGVYGITAAEVENESKPNAQRGWDEATLDAIDAAHAWQEVMGDRRRTEA